MRISHQFRASLVGLIANVGTCVSSATHADSGNVRIRRRSRRGPRGRRRSQDWCRYTRKLFAKRQVAGRRDPGACTSIAEQRQSRRAAASREGRCLGCTGASNWIPAASQVRTKSPEFSSAPARSRYHRDFWCKMALDFFRISPAGCALFQASCFQRRCEPALCAHDDQPRGCFVRDPRRTASPDGTDLAGRQRQFIPCGAPLGMRVLRLRAP